MKMNYDKLISASQKKMFMCGRKDGLFKSSESLNLNNQKPTVGYAPHY